VEEEVMDKNDIYFHDNSGGTLIEIGPFCEFSFCNIGKLSWNNGYMEFEGEAAESAKVFFDFLKPYIDNYINDELDKNKEK
jgi:hypothetical protein